MARVHAIANAKDGIGEATSATSLGTISTMVGHDVVAVSGDLGMPNLADALGVDPDGAIFHDVLMGEATVETAVYDGPAGLSVLPGSNALEVFVTINAKELEPVISTLEVSYDIIIIDTDAGLNDNAFVLLKSVDEIILIPTTERETFGDTEKTRQLADRIDADMVGAVPTRADQLKPNADVVASFLDAGVITIIPESPAIREAFNTRDPAVAHPSDSITAAGYRALVEAFAGTSAPVPGLDDEMGEADVTPEPADVADPEPNPEPTPNSDFVEGSGDGVGDGAGPAATPDLDSGSDSVVDLDATVIAGEDRVMADLELESEAEPNVEAGPKGESTVETEPEAESNVETEPEPAVDSDIDDDLTALIPLSTSTAEEPDDPAELGPTDDADASEPAVDLTADPAVNPNDDVSIDPLAADTPDDPVLTDSDPVGDEEIDTNPLVVNLDVATHGTPVADEEAVAMADDEIVPDIDADADSADMDPLTEDTAADESRSTSSASIEGTDAPGASEPLVAEAEPDTIEAELDATEVNPGADDSPKDDEEGVYTTSLVKEVESFNGDERDEKKKGLLSHFLS